MPFIETRDHTTLFYTEWGAGKPIVFIHGWAVGSGMWEYQMADLADQGYRCIAYDRRGCGRSDHPAQGYDFDTFTDDLAALIEQLDLNEVTLVAHSMGGGEVARYLARYGASRISRAVFITSTTPFMLKTDDNPDGIDEGVFQHMIDGLREDRPHYIVTNAPSFYDMPKFDVSPETLQWTIGLALQASPRGTIEMVKALSRTDFRADMKAVTVPTLIIHSDVDPSAPLEQTGKKTAAAIPHSQFKLYEGAPHGLFITHRERLNADLLAFLKE